MKQRAPRQSDRNDATARPRTLRKVAKEGGKAERPLHHSLFRSLLLFAPFRVFRGPGFESFRPKGARQPKAQAGRRGFTLLEILIGIVLLSILGLLIVQLVTATARVISLSNRGIDAASQARLAFDRIGLDLAGLVKRSDVDFQATNSVGAGPPYGLMLLSEVTSAGVATTNNRGVSLIGYQINTNAETVIPCLLRGGVPLTWTGSNSQGVTGNQTNGLPVSLSTIPVALSAADFDVLAPAVIRAVVGFQLYPTGEDTELADGTTVAANGQVVYSPPIRFEAGGTASTIIDKSLISSLIVGLVVVSPESLKLINAAQITALAGCFPVPAVGELPVGNWTSIAEDVDGLRATTGGIPLPVLQSVRVFQRAYPITPYQGALP